MLVDILISPFDLLSRVRALAAASKTFTNPRRVFFSKR
jgi:hypothetical protein